MGGKQLGLALLIVAGVGCGSSPPAEPPASADNGGSGGSASGGGKGGHDGSGGKVTPPAREDAAADTTSVTPPGPDAAAEAPTGTSPDASLTAEPDAATPDTAAPLGAFPLEAVKAAKLTQYVAANAHPEGPTWRNGELFFAADGAGWGLMRVDANRKLYRYQPKLAPIGSYSLADGSMLYCDHNLVLVQIFKDDTIAQLATDFEGKAIENCNDITVDGAGNMYLSARRTGFIYRITPAGEVARVLGGLNNPNGVEVDPQSKYLYFTTSGSVERVLLPEGGVSAFPKPERIASPDRADGLQFDLWGNLWASSYGEKQLIVYSPEGKVITTIDVPNAINFTFGGKDNDTIFVQEDFKGIYQLGPIPGLRGVTHPGAGKYQVKKMLDLVPVNEPK